MLAKAKAKMMQALEKDAKLKQAEAEKTRLIDLK